MIVALKSAVSNLSASFTHLTHWLTLLIHTHKHKQGHVIVLFSSDSMQKASISELRLVDIAVLYIDCMLLKKLSMTCSIAQNCYGKNIYSFFRDLSKITLKQRYCAYITYILYCCYNAIRLAAERKSKKSQFTNIVRVFTVSSACKLHLKLT